MLPERRWNRRWLRRYQIIAFLGILAVVMPLFEFASLWCAGEYATPTALALAPPLLLFGYGLQYLFSARWREEPRVHSISEAPHAHLSPLSRLLSMTLSGSLGLLLGWFVGWYLISLRDLPTRNHLGPYLMAVICAVVPMVGTLIVPYAFNQLLGLHTVLEFFALYCLVFGLQTFWGQGVSLLFVLCFWTFFLCLMLIVNQEYVIKPSYFSDTCYATGQLRRAGMASAFRLWLGTVLMQIPLLMAIVLVVMPFRLLFMVESLIWKFPFPQAPTVNMLLFAASVIAAVIGVIVFFLRLQHEDVRGWLRQLQAVLYALGQRLRAIFRLPKRKRREAATEGEPQVRHYVDTMTTLPPRRAARVWNARSFRRRLQSLHSAEEQYCFAYRVLVDRLLIKGIGLHPTQTPREMAQIVMDKTTVSDMGELTEIFLRSAYARDRWASEEDVAWISEVTLALLEHDSNTLYT